jgi:hypothetical protein
MEGGICLPVIKVLQGTTDNLDGGTQLRVDIWLSPPPEHLDAGIEALNCLFIGTKFFYIS